MRTRNNTHLFRKNVKGTATKSSIKLSISLGATADVLHGPERGKLEGPLVEQPCCVLTEEWLRNVDHVAILTSQ